MKRTTYLLVLLTLAFLPATAKAGLEFVEGFEDVAGLEARGWAIRNNSEPNPGTSSWFQGSEFPPQAGPANSYVGADQNSVDNVPSPGGTISNWLITPVFQFQGSEFSFWTRAVGFFPDRLQVRLSVNGASPNVGTLATDVGDFQELLIDINPQYLADGYPDEDWALYSQSLSQFDGQTGRLAFRYFVENGGPRGENSNAIGIDTFRLTSVPEPSSALVLLLGSLCLVRRRRI